MGILDRLGLAPKAQIDSLRTELDTLKASMPNFEKWMLATAGAEQYNMPDPSVFGNQADLYRKLSWVLLAVDLTASSSALTPFSVARIISGKEPKDIPNHPFEQLLNHPNELDSRYEFLYATIAFWTLTGNAYWWLNRPDANTPPDEMWFIPSQMIIPVPDENMFLKGYYYYPGNGMEILLPPHEIVQFRRFNPFSRFLGLSAIEAIALVAQGDIGMQDWNTRLFKENNARLPGVLTFEQMVADPTWNKIKEDTREAAKKRELLMLRGVGQGGVQWLQNAVSQREMEFLDGRKANKEEIMTTIAPGSFTMLSENATQANSVVGRASFNELTVYPKHVLMAEKITNSILPAYGGRQLIGHFEDIRVTDKDMKLREQDKFELSHTLKEVREEIYGDEPLGDERDDLLISQINSATGKPVEPPAVPVVDNVKPDNKEAEITQEETEPDDSEAVKAEVDRWKRKALKKVGAFVPFESDIIPDYVRQQIEGGLVTCKSENDLRRLFASAVIDEKRVELTVTALRQALNFKVNNGEHKKKVISVKGGDGSGNFGHAGRPGEVGGSSPNNGGTVMEKWEDKIKLYKEKNVEIAMLAPKTKAPSNLQKYIDDAYELGSNAKNKGIRNFEQAVRDDSMWPLIDKFDFPEQVAFQAGLSGKEKPYWVNGWRYGHIPESGQSKNFAEGILEAGVSVMAIDNGMSTSDPSFEMFGGSRGGNNKIYVSGFLNTNKKGGDGEPLLLWAKKTGDIK